MSDQKISKDSLDAGSLQASDCGISPCNSPDGPKTEKYGMAAPPASRFQLPDDKKVKQTLDTYGPSGNVSSRSAALQASLENRLARRLPTGGLTMFIKGWRRKATPLGRLYCQLAVSAHPIAATDSALWQTPRANKLTEHTREDFSPNLMQQALWATAKKSTGDYQYDKSGKKILNLSGQAALWATTTGDHKDGEYCPNVPENCLLGRQVWSGSGAQTEKRGSLNPEFAFWLQGIPLEFICSMQRAMQSFRSSGRSSSKASSKRKQTCDLSKEFI